MKPSAYLILITICAAFLTGYFLSPTGRYQIHETSIFTLRVDTRTGATWMFAGDSWRRLKWETVEK